MFESFILAIQFLTRLPTPAIKNFDNTQVGLSVLFFPFVGLGIGVLIVLFSWWAKDLNSSVLSTLVLLFWVMVTGGLHLDGLADCADAWAGGLSGKERTLEIMKDSSSGPIAVIVLILILMLKWTAISQLIIQQQLTALVLVPVLGRLSILALMLTTPYIRQQGLGETMHNNLPKTGAKIVLFSGLIMCISLLGILPVTLFILVVWLLRQFTIKRLGGCTGDVYGATVEITEAAVLVMLSA